VDVIRPRITETTALGAAFAAGIAIGYWESEHDVIATWNEDKRWTPKMARLERDQLYRNWKKAVTKTMGWVDEDVET
jgi:glycerol kinase